MSRIEYVASIDEFQSALLNLPRNVRFDRWRELLVAHYNMQGHKATCKCLSTVLRRSSGGVIPSYGHLGRRILDRLPRQSQEHVEAENGRMMDVFAMSERIDNGDIVWTLRTEVVSALERLGWVHKQISLESVDGPTITHDGLVDASKVAASGHTILRMQKRTAESTDPLGMVGLLGEPTRQDEKSGDPQMTATEAVIMARIGQERFRRNLMDIWNGQCAVTQVAANWLLRASHIKPWEDATDEERLDPFNGLPLTPVLDVAFDRGYITFADSGEIAIAIDEAENLAILGIHPGMRLTRVHDQNLGYLSYHREHVFKDNQ